MIPRPNIVPDELLPGSVLGKYEILRKLATGGMAEIYLARARGVAGFEKTVVLKRILPHVAEDEVFVHMFLDEARLAATLQHPNIADVYDVGEALGTPFFTMEYVHGQDVRAIRAATRKRDEHVPIAMALAIIHGTAAALDYAHERTDPDGQPIQLVHRDVSPSNIVVSYDGAIKLLDFGIARASSHRHKTQVGALKGKTPYMSPEQCRAQRLDRRSDLFSLGTVMYELTAGRRPFRGENDFVIMEQIVRGVAAPPSTVSPGYPPELEAIVVRLLAPSPDARYQTAEELLHDLEQFISKHGLWVSSRPLGKYMRLLFAERIDAWERAAKEGVSLSDHVAETITSESQRVERITPPSAHPRLLRLSQEIPAVRLPSQQIAAVAHPFEDVATQPELEPVAPARPTPLPSPLHQLAQARPSYQPLAAMHPQLEQVVPAMELGATGIDPAQPAAAGSSSHALVTAGAGIEPYPELRSGRPALIALGILIAAGIVAGAFYAWPMVFPKQAAPPATPAAVEVAAPQPSAAAQPTAEPAQPQPTAAAPPAPAPIPTPAPAPKAAAPAPKAAATMPKAAAPAPRPTTPAIAPKRIPPWPPAKTTPRTPSTKQPGTPKDNTWDPNSPFLPPSS